MTLVLQKQHGGMEELLDLLKDPVFPQDLEGAALASLNHVNLVDQHVEIAMDDTPHLSFLVLVGHFAHHQHADLLQMEMENMINYVPKYANILFIYHFYSKSVSNYMKFAN